MEISDSSLASRIIDEMMVRYATDGLKVSDVIDLSDEEEVDEEEELSE